jgi:uncharacterized membrane protein YjjB (DUF3815 family)
MFSQTHLGTLAGSMLRMITNNIFVVLRQFSARKSSCYDQFLSKLALHTHVEKNAHFANLLAKIVTLVPGLCSAVERGLKIDK